MIIFFGHSVFAQTKKQKEEKRTKDLEEQGQWKTLWEEANKTAQEKDQQINN